MSEYKKTLIVIPTYNEVENISLILCKALVAAPTADILVADDNSPDGTGEWVEEFVKSNPRVHLLKRPKKEGLALAYLDSFRWGFERGYEWFIQMDADFSHAPSDLPRILEGMAKHDLVIASRYIDGGSTSGWGWMRKLISRGGNTYARAILQTSVHDITGGYNGWKREILEKIHFQTVRSKGYAYQVEMKYRAAKAGCDILEIPIHFKNRTIGTSKMSGAIVGEAALRVLQMRTT